MIEHRSPHLPFGGLGTTYVKSNRELFMLSMRTLLSANPFLSLETQQSVVNRSRSAREALVVLGVSECEARELLDEKADCSTRRPVLGSSIG